MIYYKMIKLLKFKMIMILLNNSFITINIHKMIVMMMMNLVYNYLIEIQMKGLIMTKNNKFLKKQLNFNILINKC